MRDCSAWICATSTIERLSVLLLPHVRDVQLVLPLPDVVELLGTAAGCRRLTVRIVEGAGHCKPARDETAENRALNERSPSFPSRIRHDQFPSIRQPCPYGFFGESDLNGLPAP